MRPVCANKLYRSVTGTCLFFDNGRAYLIFQDDRDPKLLFNFDAKVPLQIKDHTGLVTAMVKATAPLIDAGYSNSDLKDGGYTEEELKAIDDFESEPVILGQIHLWRPRRRRRTETVRSLPGDAIFSESPAVPCTSQDDSLLDLLGESGSP